MHKLKAKMLSIRYCRGSNGVLPTGYYMDKSKRNLILIAMAAVALVLVASAVIAISTAVKRVRELAPPETTISVRNTTFLTFPEGYTAYDIAVKLEESNVCSKEEFLTLVNTLNEGDLFYGDIDNAAGRPFKLEGYIFPDTYEFYLNSSAQSVLDKFLSNADAKFSDEYRARAEELGMTMDEVITLASIIQKESGAESEMRKVSSVFHNRLKSDGYPKLQSDVTIQYIENTVKPYYNDTDEYNDTYNTYKCNGLPTGAICNPGRAAIEAALYPENTDYYYFVTDNNGNYYYASTFAEHQKNCDKAGT